MQKYRIADHKLFQVDGHDFLFLVADNAIFEIERPQKVILDRCTAANPLSKADLLARFDGSADDKDQMFQDLLQRHVLWPLNGNADPGKIGQAAIPLKTLVLHVTDACNLGCLYCYHGQGVQPVRRHGPMTLEVARKAIDFLFDRSGDLQQVAVVFFGGEPLLNFRLITAAVAYARAKAAETGKKVDFAVTTNACLLTPEIIAFLNEHHIGVTISMDGFQKVHDRYRRFPDGSPSYDIILPKIKTLLRSTPPKPVVARVTLCREPTDVPQILEHLLDLGFAEVGFAPVTTRDAAYQIDSAGMDLVLGQFKELAEQFLLAAQKDELLGFTNLIDLLVTLHEGEVKNYPCGAGLGLFAVNAAGRLYLCQRLTEDEHCAMGDIFKGIDNERVSVFRQQAEIGRKAACQSCWVRTICAGGCYHEALIRQGGLTRANLHYCDWISKWVETGLETYARIALSDSLYLEKLSMLRGHATIYNQLV